MNLMQFMLNLDEAEILELLIANGADISLSYFHNGISLLHLAALHSELLYAV